MLRLIIGKAGAGKTAAVIREIRQAVEERRGGSILLVPEQYSHEAERELCAACGDSLSLYGEVLSFTGLARRVAARQGGGAASLLDRGGRLLCMALAMDAVDARLRLYGGARRNGELQAVLLQALDELKSACVSPEMLEAASLACPDALGDKLHDLSLIAAAYDAAVARGHADPADRLTVLARQIPQSELGPDTHVYVDGFIDFTAQERAVLEALLRKGVQMTVCLTVDSLDQGSEIFALSRTAARRLLAQARELGLESQIQRLDAESRDPALAFFADKLFSYDAQRYPGEAPLRLYAAASRSEECELAAALALSLVRDGGCRWRDVAVAVRGFEDYRGMLESVFRHYGVPLFTARRSPMRSKPLPALIALSFQILEGGWDTDDVISYIRTGLAGLDAAEGDLLADYLFTWQLRASAWQRAGDWRQHPEGFGGVYDQVAEERLAQINSLRRRLAGPLRQLQRDGEQAVTARQQAAALADYLERLRLPQQLQRRQQELEAEGRQELAQEYRQLWELTVSALEQCAAVLGDMALDQASFGRLFTRMLDQYDLGIIPVSLDRVSAGDFDRMRRRRIRHLIVLGCSDDRLPPAQESTGLFDQEERQRLLDRDIDLGGGEDELWREFSLLYNCLSLPAESLSLSYALGGGEGESLRPAYVYGRAAALFGLEPERVEPERLRLSAPAPAMSLAAQGLRQGGAAAAAAAYFRQEAPERFRRLEAAACQSRGSLSRQAVEGLYGKELRFSPSRIDRFADCQFAHFCQYGLRLKPKEPARFSPPEIGSFMHDVLENTAREVKDRGGFAAVDDESLRRITDSYVQRYVTEKLNDFQEKSSRFVYLFKRLCADVHRVVEDMAQELRRSDFEPLDFELDFARAGHTIPLESEEGESSLRLTGVADRVDGWLHQGKLYLRVVDYKTGRKSFSLSEVWYGRGLQMLLYLFTLEAEGESSYGYPVVPAGVMYVPARDVRLSLKTAESDEEIGKKRAEQLRRSGLVLDDEALIQAWEKGEDKRYIPVKLKGRAGSDALASAERLGQLARHIRKTLGDMAGQLRRGSIAADPFYRGQQENACLNCRFYEACHFSDGENGERYRVLPKLRDEQVWQRLAAEERGEIEDGS